MQRHLVFILLVLCSLVLSSCGGRVVERNPTPTAQPTEEHSIANIKSATIRIVIEAAVVKAAVGEDLDVGSGSGFIIDQSGIAVTNNHVVSGASTISVWVGNETEPRKAQVLGVSECSDLAVIDIEGEGYPYLNWFEGKIEPPLEVLAVGFPFGDPEITMTDGIVAKAKVTENLIRAAVEAPIEHTATLNPGNSGGPLVTKDGGEVVGDNHQHIVSIKTISTA